MLFASKLVLVYKFVDVNLIPASGNQLYLHLRFYCQRVLLAEDKVIYPTVQISEKQERIILQIIEVCPEIEIVHTIAIAGRGNRKERKRKSGK